MNDTTPQVVKGYLRQLDDALVGIPDVVRGEILAGVREELTGLDAATAAARIEELGDPAFIAAEARAGAGESPVAAPSAGGWLPVVAGLLVAFGGIVIPIVGWAVGVVLVWMSRSWRTWEKLVATLAAPAALVVILIVYAVVSALNTSVVTPGGDQLNPLVPPIYDVLTLSLVVMAVNVLAGLWLLWRLRRSRPAADTVASVPPTPANSVVTALIVAFGGIVVPLVGWVAGITMMWFSRVWWPWEKWVVTIAPVVSAIGGNIVLWALAAANGSDGGSSVQVFGIPLTLSGVDTFTLAAVVYIVTAASGFWLLFRARRVPRPQP